MKKLALILIAVLVVFSFVGIMFHHHAGEEPHECAVCRLIQAVSGIFVLALTSLLIAAFSVQKWLTVFKTRFSSLSIASSLKDRAPPASSF